jgi:hypothetical protein
MLQRWPRHSSSPAKRVRRRLTHLWARMRQAAAAGEPAVGAGLGHFLKVTRSYRPGRFHGYDSADLPRTNNDLEHAVGSPRDHERRASGRRRASPGLVVMGSARVISGWATRLRPEEGLSGGSCWCLFAFRPFCVMPAATLRLVSRVLGLGHLERTSSMVP